MTCHHKKPTLVERLAKEKDEEFWALKDVNLTIKKGVLTNLSIFVTINGSNSTINDNI